MSISSLKSRIRPLDEAAMAEARTRQDMLTKPQGSLGRLERLSVQVAGITGQALPKIEHKLVALMAGDHGVVADGVSAYPQDVTPQMVENILNGGAAINVLSRHVGARVVVTDMGVAADIPPRAGLNICKIAHGTGNIARGPAMTRQQAEQAIMTGVAIIDKEVQQGLDVVATGDMGIGNTTPSAAIAAVFTGLSAEQIVGRGTGVDNAGLQRKISAVQRALEVNKPDSQDGLDVLAKVGGFEIGGLAGVILGAAANQRPVVVDGFISTAAAMIAVSIEPLARDYIISAHRSQETGHRLMLEWLKVEPLLDLDMRLGEGTGAVLAIPLIEAACKVLAEMATFGEAGVSEKSE